MRNYFAVFVHQRIIGPVFARLAKARGDARFTGFTIGNWMFGVWHWPPGPRAPREPLSPLDAGEP